MSLTMLSDGSIDALSSDGSVVCLDPIVRPKAVEVGTTLVGYSGLMMLGDMPSTVGLVVTRYFKRTSPGKTPPACNVIVSYENDQTLPAFYSNDDDVICWDGAESAQLVPRLGRRR